VYEQIGGDPSALMSVLSQHINLYAELTGVLPARLGAQTVSHTTAYSKQAELQRGATRTVDYVNQCGDGPVLQWLDMAYRMGRNEMGKNDDITFWIEAYGGFVNVEKEQLPEEVTWEWFGAGGPQESQAKTQQRLGALNTALQMDVMALKTGRPPTLNIAGAIKETLREGGWADIDALTFSQGAAGGPQAAPALPAAGGGPQGGAPPPEALQALAGAGG
jgi:hypothetical protein